MIALFIVLNDTSYLEDVLAKLTEMGAGATILDSQGMASAIVHNKIDNIPLFGSFKNILAGSHPFNKTIFTVLEDEELAEKVADSIQKVMNGKSKYNGAGFMFTVSVGKVYMIGKGNNHIGNK